MLSVNDPLFNKYIKFPLISLLILLAIVTVGIYFFASTQEDLNSNLNSKDRELKVILKQIRFLRSQENLFIKYGAQYQGFLEDGLVNELDRVKWTDELLKTQKKLAFKDLSIQFEPEKKIIKRELKNLKMSKNIFYSSQLNITAGVHSDLDILELFKIIDQEITPLYLIPECKIVGDLNKLTKVFFNKDGALFTLKCSIILFQSKPREFNLK